MPKKKSHIELGRIKFNRGDIKVLRELYIHEYGLNQDELVKMTGITKGGVSKILKKLRGIGWAYNILGDIHIYRIVPERRYEVGRFLKAYDKGKKENNLFSCHAYVIECLVNELPKEFLKKITKDHGWIEYLPKNWSG